MAAAAKLTLEDHKTRFARQDIINEMKTAEHYDKDSFRGGNLTSALKTLINNGKLVTHGSGAYSLSAAGLEEVSKVVNVIRGQGS